MADCIFCQIVRQEIPAEYIHESDGFIVIKDIMPKAPVHLLIISTEHIPSLNELEPRHQELLGAMVLQAKESAAAFGLKTGYKLVVNCGPDAGQVVPHLHIHVLGGKNLTALV